jgi:hypothetical protein
MGTLHQNRKGASVEIKSAKLKKGENISVYRQTNDNKEEGQKGCLPAFISTTRDDKMVQTRVQGQDMEKSKVVTDYNSKMGGVNLSGTYLTGYCSTRKRLKKIISKALLSFD